MRKILPHETLIQGKWLFQEGRVVGDESCCRIESLIDGHLIEMARADGGWSTLYEDPNDRRLWERTYPQSGLHGGGPPSLRLVSKEEAKRRFGLLSKGAIRNSRLREELRKLTGKPIENVSMKVLFWGDDHEGEAVDVSVSFAGGRRYFFGCAGDGSILITQRRKQMGDAPNTNSEWRTLPNLQGELQEVGFGSTWLRLRIDDRILLITNDDDEISIAADGKSLCRDFYRRC